jgi:hypothetical protein
MKWLDTETKALLQGIPPEKLALPATATFTLVLLEVGELGYDAFINAIQRAANISTDEIARICGHRLPVPIKKGLSYPDALIAQFELICCDIVSVLIADEVVAGAPADYMAMLYAKLRKSDEFELVDVRIDSIPDTPSGREFFNRFLSGREPISSATVIKLMRKKARIMQHWALKIGINLS